MFVKKFSIPQPLSALPKSVRSLCRKTDRLLFLDIETTGLSPAQNFIYLIGVLIYEETQALCCQWFAEEPAEECAVLEAFLEAQQDASVFLHYNGAQFDLPFLQKRCASLGLSFAFEDRISYDLCQALKPCRTLLKLENGKLSSIERFLGKEREKDCGGRDGIRLYQKYCGSRGEALREPLLLHNERDLRVLPQAAALLSYRQLLDGTFSLTNICREDGGITARLTLPEPLLVRFSYGASEVYVTGEGTNAGVRLFPKDGRLRKYYADWKNYYYLPAEDSAVHKSLASYISRSAKQKASRENCYTWFFLSDELLCDTAQMERYLQENLRYLLGFFTNF